MFKDRSDAGGHLASLLENYRGDRPVVLGLVRRGAVEPPGQRAVQLKPWLYEIPPTSRPGMRVPARIYADQVLWERSGAITPSIS